MKEWPQNPHVFAIPRVLLRWASLGAALSTSPAAFAQDETPPAGDAKPPSHQSAPDGASISLGAHLNRSVNVVQDGRSLSTFFVDNGNVPTFLYVKGSYPATDDLTIGGHIEFAVRANGAASINQNQPSVPLAIASRFFEATFESSRYGKLYFGRGFMASFMLAELDQSGTVPYNLMSVGNTGSGLLFVDSTTGDLSALNVGAAFVDFEAFSFNDRIRYDSPSFHGFSLQGSVGTSSSADLALKFKRTLGAFQVFSGTSFQYRPPSGRNQWRADGGAGVLHLESGVNFSGGVVVQEYTEEYYQSLERSEGHSAGLTMKAGIRRNWFGIGESKVAADYSSLEDVLYRGDEARSIGVFLGQVIDPWGAIEPYLGYRIYDLRLGANSQSLSVDPLQVWTIGLRFGYGVTLKP